ncbi:MAG: prepilin-type N-terminal cleavage/methylation domain-containing protein [Leptospirillia bacterium]
MGPLNRQDGFTLIEMMVAIAISMIVVGGAFSAFTYQDKVLRSQGYVTEMQQNVRAVMDMMVGEVQMAAYGIPSANLAWIDWVAMGSNPQITDGGAGNPDTISFAAAFDGTLGTLAGAEPANSSSIDLSSATEAANFDTATKKLFLLGYNELGEIKNVVGNTLQVDMNGPGAGNTNTASDYIAGAAVERIKVITYSLSGTNLMRNENQGDGDQILAENIEDFQVSQAGNTVTITVTARTEKPDPDYGGDGYRRITVPIEINLRNG